MKKTFSHSKYPSLIQDFIIEYIYEPKEATLCDLTRIIYDFFLLLGVGVLLSVVYVGLLHIAMLYESYVEVQEHFKKVFG